VPIQASQTKAAWWVATAATRGLGNFSTTAPPSTSSIAPNKRLYRPSETRTFSTNPSIVSPTCSAGILWLGCNGFNGGDPYFANADAGAAVLNTNTAACVGVMVWTMMDYMAYGKPSVIGAVNGMIAGLVAITPAAGYVTGWGAITIGICAGILASPDMLEYVGTGKEAPGVSITGLLYGNPHQLLVQIYAAAFIIVYNVIATFIILKAISFITPLRMDETTLKVGDDAVHGETAYAIGREGV
jgi:ammonium transporter, Amt family